MLLTTRLLDYPTKRLLCLSMQLMLAAGRAVLLQLHAPGVVAPVLLGDVIVVLALGADQRHLHPDFLLSHASRPVYSLTAVMTPAPTVRPPSRMAKWLPASSATGVISFTVMLMLSPGITISTPAGSVISPVTSIVRM